MTGAVIISIAIAVFLFRGFIFNRLAAKIMLRAGAPMRFGAYTVFIDGIEGNKLYGIKITGNNKRLQAKSGAYEYLPQEQAITFNLADGAAENTDEGNPGISQKLSFKQFQMKIKLKSLASGKAGF